MICIYIYIYTYCIYTLVFLYYVSYMFRMPHGPLSRAGSCLITPPDVSLIVDLMH